MSPEIGRLPVHADEYEPDVDPYEGLDEDQIDYLNDPTQMSKSVAAQLAREYPQEGSHEQS